MIFARRPTRPRNCRRVDLLTTVVMLSSGAMSETTTDTTDLSHADVGIVYALPQEITPLLDRLDRVRKVTGQGFAVRGGWWEGRRIALIESGPGRGKAAGATRVLLDGHTPSWVLSTGFAGALTADVHRGDIVMANEIVGPAGEHFQIDFRIEREQVEATKGLHVGRLLTVDRIVRTAEEKRKLGQQHGALAVDMESLAVAEVCRDRAHRFLSVRVISDEMQADLPPEVMSVLGSTRTFRAGAALGALWKRPGSFRDLWKLREQAHDAAERLATFLEGVIEQLA